MSFFDPLKKKNFKSITSCDPLVEPYKKDLPPYSTCILGLSPHWTENLLKEKAFKTHSVLGMNLSHRKDKEDLAWAYNLGMGASGVALRLEQLISLGIKNFVLVGLCGSLNSSLKIGSLCRIKKALCAEGVSPHYAHFDESFPGKILSKKLKGSVSCYEASCWSTDAPFRETHHEIDHYQRQGMEVVDMETSALFSVADYRKVELVSYLVVSDELFYDDWKRGYNLPVVKKTYQSVIESLAKAL